MQHHKVTLMLAVLAALLTAHGTARAQFTFGHPGDFSSVQGAPAQWSTTAPGMYASGQYLTAGPWNYPLGHMNQPGPYPIVQYARQYGPNIYFPSSQPSPYQQGGYREYPTQPNGNNLYQSAPSNPYGLYGPQGGSPAYAAPRPTTPSQGNDVDRYHYNRGFEAGYNAGQSNGTWRRVPQAPPMPFMSN